MCYLFYNKITKNIICNYYIHRWHNGTGNQLLAMVNIIHFTYNFKKHNECSFPFNKYFEFKPNNEIKREIVCDCSNNMDITRKINPCSDYFLLHLDEIKSIFNNYITFKKYENIERYYDIGIHIRSGDIFSNNIHWEYVQPPLDYYIQFIKHNPNKSMIFVFENKNNPVIDKIIDYVSENKLTNITFQSDFSHIDMLTLANCKNLVFSMGTYCIIPYVLSTYVERIVLTNFMFNKPRGKNWYKAPITSDKLRVVNLPSYIKVGSWKKKPEQVEKMLNYKIIEEELYKFNLS